MILDGRPLRGKELDQLKDFLGSREVEYDPEAEYTVCLLNDSYEIEAAGSVCGHVICCGICLLSSILPRRRLM